jgi:hypothetical protein
LAVSENSTEQLIDPNHKVQPPSQGQDRELPASLPADIYAISSELQKKYLQNMNK